MNDSPSQLPGDWFQVHEVAESGTSALSHLVLATARLAEVRHRTQLGVDWTATEPPVIQVCHCSLGVLLSSKLKIK